MPVKEGPRAATPDDSRKPDLAGGLGESSSSYPAICVSGATSVAPHIQGGRHIEAIGHLAQRSVRRQGYAQNTRKKFHAQPCKSNNMNKNS